MAAKDTALKRQLIKEGILCVLALAVLAGGGVLLSSYDDDAQSVKQTKESQNAGMRSEYEAIQQQLGTGFEMSAFYEAYSKSRNSELQLKRDAATQLMSTLREKNHLTNLTVTISPISDVNPDFGQIKSGTLTRSEVKLSFGAVTDNSVYGFMEALERKLPGIVVFQDIKLTRESEPSREMLVELSQHRLTPLIKGELTFTWIGIRPLEEDKMAPRATSSISDGPRHGL
jgi:hypothetical protein